MRTIPGVVPDIADTVSQRALVEDVLGRLSDRHRYILLARYVEDRRVSDIAAELGVTEGAVQSALARARHAFVSSYPGGRVDQVQ